LLTSVNPLARGIDLAVCLDRCHNCAGGHVHFPSLFNDPLERGPDIALAFREQSNRMRVPVDGLLRRSAGE
jgi:hypothetical protein